MLEESTKTFYDVDTITSELGNPSTWTYLGLSPSIVGQRPAIIIPNRLNDDWQKRLIEKGCKENVSVYPNFEVGRLVSVERQEGNVVFAKILGKVNICPCKPNVMSWEGLKDKKGPVLPDEMKNGLLAKLYGGINKDKPFVHPEILAKMPREWHVDPAALNYELDATFASGMMVEEGKVKWMLEGDEDEEEI